MIQNIVSFFLTALLFAGCGRSYQDPIAKLSPSVEKSIQLLPKITEDIDRRGSYAEKIAETLASQGCLNRAVDVVRNDPSPHGPYTLYSLAIQMSRKGNISQARHIDAMARELAKSKGYSESRMVMIQEAIARSALKDDAGATRSLEAITTPYDRQEAETGVIAERIRQGREDLKVSVPLATPAITEAWCGRALLASPSDQSAFLEAAASNARQTFPVQRPRLLVLCAQTAEKMGLKTESVAYFAEAESAASVLSDRIEDGPIEKSKLAVALAQAGQREKAREILARTHLASRLPAAFYQPLALGRVAEGYSALGDKEMANEVWLEAALNAKGHVHPNARVINSIEIYLSHVRAGAEPSEKVAAVLASIDRGEGGDGPMVLPPEIEEIKNRIFKEIKEKESDSKKKSSSENNKTN